MRHRVWGLLACTIVLGLGGFGAAGCGSDASLASPDGTPGDSEVVTPGADDSIPEGDGEIAPPSGAVEDCATAGDEDGDGVADCSDTDCAAEPACVAPLATEGDCGDGIDGDADGAVDCGDTDCAADAACALPPPAVAEDCTTSADEDGDGQGQCGDSDCAFHVLCAGGGDGGIYTIHPDYLERIPIEKKPWPGPGPECLSCPYDFGIRKDVISDPATEINLDQRDFGF